jgi:predicted HAD superfamily phosphohydrolase
MDDKAPTLADILKSVEHIELLAHRRNPHEHIEEHLKILKAQIHEMGLAQNETDKELAELKGALAVVGKHLNPAIAEATAMIPDHETAMSMHKLRIHVSMSSTSENRHLNRVANYLVDNFPNYMLSHYGARKDAKKSCHLQIGKEGIINSIRALTKSGRLMIPTEMH